jgi:hypothetical protein
MTDVPKGVWGYPLAPQKPTDVEGVDFDPYASPDQIANIWNPEIPFHSYRKIHIFMNGVYAGLKCTAYENLPVCPVLWQTGDGGSHYWDGGVVAGYEMKRYLAGAAVGAVSVIGTAKLLGVG